MNFRLDSWCDERGGLHGAVAAQDALSSLRWSLSTFETPQPIAINLAGIQKITSDFIEGFFGAIGREWPESYFGRHQIVVVGADPAIAAELRIQLRACGVPVPVAERAPG